MLHGEGEGEVAFFSAKRCDRRNRADLIESATPCHDARVVGLCRDSNPLRLTILAAMSEDYTTVPQHLHTGVVMNKHPQRLCPYVCPNQLTSVQTLAKKELNFLDVESLSLIAACRKIFSKNQQFRYICGKFCGNMVMLLHNNRHVRGGAAECVFLFQKTMV